MRAQDLFAIGWTVTTDGVIRGPDGTIWAAREIHNGRHGWNKHPVRGPIEADVKTLQDYFEEQQP